MYTPFIENNIYCQYFVQNQVHLDAYIFFYLYLLYFHTRILNIVCLAMDAITNNCFCILEIFLKSNKEAMNTLL